MLKVKHRQSVKKKKTQQKGFSLFSQQYFVKIVVSLLIVGLYWIGFSAIPGTVAFYFDTETSEGNLFDAALLDFELSSPADFAPEVSMQEDAERQISVTDIQSIAFHYRVHAENFVGPLCGVLDLQAFLKNDQKYSGPLVDFQAGDFGFAQPEAWEYIASLTSSNPIFHGTTCQFDLVHSGWQIQFPILFSGFHDIETIPSLITATAPQCNALSQGYWRNNEGCNQGQGTSDWTLEINDLSSGYSSIFSSITSGGICESLWVPNCSDENTVESKLCKAEAHTLANELNIVSGRQDVAALLAWADDGSSAFDNLGLSPSSTVEEALDAIETVLANPSASFQQLVDADYVAERIYAFYEEENPIAPQCVYDLDDVEVEIVQFNLGGGDGGSINGEVKEPSIEEIPPVISSPIFEEEIKEEFLEEGIEEGSEETAEVPAEIEGDGEVSNQEGDVTNEDPLAGQEEEIVLLEEDPEDILVIEEETSVITQEETPQESDDGVIDGGNENSE